MVFPWLFGFHQSDLEALSCSFFFAGLLGLFHKPFTLNSNFARDSSIAVGEVQTGVQLKGSSLQVL